MKYRSELLQVYSNFTKIVETQFSKRTKFFDLIILLSTLNMLSNPMALFII